MSAMTARGAATGREGGLGSIEGEFESCYLVIWRDSVTR